VADCVPTVEACQRTGEKRTLGFNWTLRLSRRWTGNTPYAAGTRIRPSEESRHTGFEYQSSGGQTNGQAEPRWPTRLGGTVRDGSIVWTAVALSVDSLLETISTSDWDVPTGLTGSSEDTVDSAGLQSTEIMLTGGADGETYEVVNEIRTSAGNEYQAVLVLSIEA